MTKYQSLYLNRQFILAPQEVNEKFDYKRHLLPNGYRLFCHKNLRVTQHTHKSDFIILLGTIFSSLDIYATNDSIISELFSYSIEQLLPDKIKYFSGRYIIILKKKDEFLIFNDASAHRKLYYTTNTDKVWCASQPHILAKILNIELSRDEETRSFYKSRQFLDRGLCGILNATPYDEIKQLTPNKLLNLKTKHISRFWPSKQIVERPIESVFEESSILLKNVIKNAASRYELMLPVTAGRDSRLLLAASRELSENVLFYTNKNKYEKQDKCDIRIPRKIFRKTKINYYVLNYDNECPEEFADIIRKNILFPYDNFNSLLYQIYYKKYPDKLNMPGICGEITYKWANRKLDNYNGQTLAEFFNFRNCNYVAKQYQVWLDEIHNLCDCCNIPTLTLFFWEEIISNWAINVSQMKDIAQDEFFPMNFLALQENMFSAPIQYRDYYSNLLFKGLVKHMWPEIAGFSYNPSWQFTLYGFLKRIKLYSLAKKLNNLIS